MKSLATTHMKHSTGLGQYWPKFVPFAKYSYNAIFIEAIAWFQDEENSFAQQEREFSNINQETWYILFHLWQVNLEPDLEKYQWSM